jgi:hypothetical protein
MQQLSLNDLYLEYSKGGIDLNKFEALIYDYFIKNKSKLNFSYLKDDEYEEYISWLFPRIQSAIKSYRDLEASFDVYMGSVFRLAFREYLTRKTNKSITEYAAWTIRVSEVYANEEPPVYSFTSEKSEPVLPQVMTTQLETEFSGINSRKKNPRQLLSLVLKCYYYLSDDFIDRIAPMIDIEKDKLKEMVDKLRLMRIKRDDGIRSMQQRIYSQFYRCYIYEKKLSYFDSDSLKADIMKQRLKNARLRLDSMRKRLAGIRTDATNQQIADVIGISKGTVDAQLYQLKAKWNDSDDKTLLN